MKNLTLTAARRGATAQRIALQRIALLAAMPALWASLAQAAERSVDEARAASANGVVDISNVAGSVQVRGWDKAELRVTGTIGGKVERVEVAANGDHSTVKVVLPALSVGGNGSADLLVQVPMNSAVNVTLVSADLALTGVNGDLNLRTISGNIEGDVGANANVNSVSGDITVAARGMHRNYELKSISGDIKATGLGNNVSVSTVSGDAELTLGTVSRAQLESVSGNVMVATQLDSGGSLAAESVSGDLTLNFVASAPSANIDVETLSGDISNCFGPKPVSPERGPGSHLSFTSGDGKGRIHAESKSGSVHLCTK
ncbi:MAG: DUF4097 family beta strand repeat-containing protein [Steroidobacteraceae bacterium]